MKRYQVSYILEDHVKTEKVVKDLNSTAEQIFDELIQTVTTTNFLKIRSEQGHDRLDTSLIRYIRVSALND
ncbi:hypothetical protein M3182_16200 [Mesobacillus maritimus]|uniref:hypothetical protein n=1 Tax=Mesobacillus maritimus TaxID=1643336 RepID=UPI00203A460C|nr:hypothetical protein [Mesobacillus maritimus]MCM3587280.1 hypothetical protein [Mesobacillus maritimus]MCM3667846.1 hypothetical protein [Mesobacillus maritimus]